LAYRPILQLERVVTWIVRFDIASITKVQQQDDVDDVDSVGGHSTKYEFFPSTDTPML
jgi:hypothetical protein